MSSIRSIIAKCLIFVLVFAWVFSGWPPIWQHSKIPPLIQQALAATFESEDFEVGFGNWTDDASGCVWVRDAGGTPSSNTGPDHDNTYGDATHYYVFVETSSSACPVSGDEANLTGPSVDGSAYSTDLSFYYHMYGASMGTLNVDVWNGASWDLAVWSISGQQQTSSAEAYTNVVVDLDAYTNDDVQIRFRYGGSSSYTGDAAIDDISITGELRVELPDAPVFYPDDGGSNQIAFNNIRQNSTSPTFRVSATHDEAFDRFQLELNTSVDFDGTAYTQTFSGTYSSGTQYNLTASSLSPSLPTTDGATYYVRARASADSGSNYGDWSSGTWTYTYKSASENPDWFQTTDEQFDTGMLEGAVASDGSVALGAAIEATGGTTDESSVEGYKLHIFTSNGTFEVTSGTGDVDALVVAGGGGAGQSGGSGGGGGGGAGGLIFDSVGVSTGQYSVVVGGGGAGGTAAGDNGSNSSFSGLTAIGGGGGANGTATPNDGSDGGSGGGARGYEVGYGGSGTAGQGNDGGDSLNSGSGSPAGGGGGAGSVGGASSASVAGNGGSGLDYSSTFGTGVGASGWFAGGGGGGSGSSAASGGTASAGGGAGGGPSTAGSNATANTGGGGGGGGSDNTNGGDGGSGVVIVRYPLAGGGAGSVTSTAIDFSWVPDMDDWDEVTVHATTTNGSITIDVLDENSADTGLGCTISGGETSCAFDISSLDPAGDDTQIYLKATLTDSGGTPYLNDWSVSWSAGGAGELTSDIVDSGGSSVSSPSLSMTTSTVSFSYQTATGTLGVASQKVRVSNTTSNPEWTLAIAATSTAFWDGASADYDFNDPTAEAGDGSDDDVLGGQMTIDPSGGTITPEGGCSDTGISLHSSGSFNEGVTNSITLVTAADTADTSCYWDFTGIDVSQTIPAEQAVDSYSIDMVITVTAV
jgi:hypothetical protein